MSSLGIGYKGFRVLGFGSKFENLGLGVEGQWFGILSSEFRVQGSGFRV